MTETATIQADRSAPGEADLDTSRWAVVIPSFNHADDVINCLASLQKTQGRPERVILVDDASTEDAIGTISRWAAQSGESYEIVDATDFVAGAATSSWLILVAAKRNAGFPVSCNIGLGYVRDHTRSPFALLLNNDAAVSSSYFPDLARGIAGAANVGLATGTIYEWDQRTVWYAGGRFNPLRAVAEHYLEVPSNGEPRETEFVCGCTMLISRAALENVGLLPECYSPCYCEDAEYSLRVQRAGFSLVYVPRAKVFHRVSSSLGREIRSPQVIYWFNRNRGYAMRRNYTGWRRAAGLGYLALSKPARALVELVRGRPKSGAAFVRGTLAGFFGPGAREP